MAPKDSAEVRVPDPGSWEVPCVLDKLPQGLCPGAVGPGFNKVSLSRAGHTPRLRVRRKGFGWWDPDPAFLLGAGIQIC